MGDVANADAATAVSNSSEEDEEEGDPMDGIFASHDGSVNLQDIPNFNSSDLTAAAASFLMSSDDICGHDDSQHQQDVMQVLPVSEHEDAGDHGHDDEEAELGAFLWDDMAGFDPALHDLSDLCLPATN